MTFGVTKVQARWRGATKLRELMLDGTIKKSNPSMKEKTWRLHPYECELTHDAIVNFRLDMAPKYDWASVCGAPAPGLDPNLFHRRLNAEKHGPDRTLFDVLRWWLVADIDDLKAPDGSNLGDPRHLEEAARFARDQLPPELRDVTVVVAVSSSSGLDPTRISMHFYFLLSEPVLVWTVYLWLKGAKKAGYRIDPRVMLPAQLLLTGRPRFVGCEDPIPPERRAFVLPGKHLRVPPIDWNGFSERLAKREAMERTAWASGAARGWRAYLNQYLGDSEGQLGFFEPLTAALGLAARLREPADAVVEEMFAILSAHPDLTDKRSGEYTEEWLHAGLRSFRDMDAKRDALTAEKLARILPTMDLS
jgi:hypothetical protein